MIWMSLDCTLSGWCSGINGEASYREKRLTLTEPEKHDTISQPEPVMQSKQEEPGIYQDQEVQIVHVLD